MGLTHPSTGMSPTKRAFTCTLHHSPQVTAQHIITLYCHAITLSQAYSMLGLNEHAVLHLMFGHSKAPVAYSLHLQLHANSVCSTTGKCSTYFCTFSAAVLGTSPKHKHSTVRTSTRFSSLARYRGSSTPRLLSGVSPSMHWTSCRCTNRRLVAPAHPACPHNTQLPLKTPFSCVSMQPVT